MSNDLSGAAPGGKLTSAGRRENRTQSTATELSPLSPQNSEVNGSRDVVMSFSWQEEESFGYWNLLEDHCAWAGLPRRLVEEVGISGRGLMGSTYHPPPSTAWTGKGSWEEKGEECGGWGHQSGKAGMQLAKRRWQQWVFQLSHQKALSWLSLNWKQTGEIDRKKWNLIL